jgi:hypothetical protein
MKRLRATLGLPLLVMLSGIGCENSGGSTPPPPAPTPTVTGVTVTGGGGSSFTFANRNQTLQLMAQARLSDATTSDVTNSATWTSSNNAVASVAGTGLVTAVGNGTATIQATHQGQTGAFATTVAMRATAEMTTAFSRLCSPFRAQMAVTLRESSGNLGFRITLLEIQMTDVNGVQRFNRALSAADLTTMLGTNFVGAGLSQTVTVQTAYPGNVDTQDSRGRVILSATDEAGNAVSINRSQINHSDRC